MLRRKAVPRVDGCSSWDLASCIRGKQECPEARFCVRERSLAFPKGLEVSGLDHDHGQSCSGNLGSGYLFFSAGCSISRPNRSLLRRRHQ